MFNVERDLVNLIDDLANDFRRRCEDGLSRQHTTVVSIIEHTLRIISLIMRVKIDNHGYDLECRKELERTIGMFSLLIAELFDSDRRW